MTSPALRISGLTKYYKRGLFNRQDSLPAVDNVDLEVSRRRVVGLIGESGSGKTSLARAALGLLPYQSGTVSLLGQELASIGRKDLLQLRKRVQMLFQNADAHLNPELNVDQTLRETVRLHRPNDHHDLLVAEILDQVGLAHRADAMPHQLSGGEKRRVGIARILLTEPELVVADEPTAGLDAALKADIIDLLLSGGKNEDTPCSHLIISHDLPLIAYACDEIHVMYAGRIVEHFPTTILGKTRHHPYTQSLLAAAGMVDEGDGRVPEIPRGRTKTGCAYVGPCPLVQPVCHTIRPLLVDRKDAGQVRCHAKEVIR